METKNDKFLKPKLGSIPNELKARKQWVCWRIEKRNSKLTKVPYNPKSKHKAKVNEKILLWVWISMIVSLMVSFIRSKWSGLSG
jgi:hypothetical protein